MRAAGVELARQIVQLNAIAQKFADNPTYLPSEVQAYATVHERLKRDAVLSRLVSGARDALFAPDLASDAAACFFGQVFPACGWAETHHGAGSFVMEILRSRPHWATSLRF